MKKRITKCYLVEIIDDEGKEIKSDFCFGTKKDCEILAEKLEKEISKEKAREI